MTLISLGSSFGAAKSENDQNAVYGRIRGHMDNLRMVTACLVKMHWWLMWEVDRIEDRRQQNQKEIW